MITVDNSQYRSVSFGDSGKLRFSGASCIPPETCVNLYCKSGYVFITGEGCAVSLRGEEIILVKDEGIIISPDTLISVNSGFGAVYAEFFSPAVIIRTPYKRIINERCSHIKDTVGGVTDSDGALRLCSELFALAAMCADKPSGAQSVSDAKNYLDTYFYLPVCVENISKAMGLSRGYFTAKFTREYGCSPYKYVSKLRISAACELLENTDASVSAIASACGYGGAERFCDMFRRYTGKTPLKYRISAKNDA